MGRDTEGHSLKPNTISEMARGFQIPFSSDLLVVVAEKDYDDKDFKTTPGFRGSLPLVISDVCLRHGLGNVSLPAKYF